MKTMLKRLVLVLMVALIVYVCKPTTATLIVGGVLVAVGAAIRIWAGGHLTRSSGLTTSGPYAYVRDPLYLGRLFLLIGLCTMAGTLWSVLIMVLGLAVFFVSYMPRKHRKEMQRLEEHYGEPYSRYAAQVRSLIPRLSPYPEADRKPWSFHQFWYDNREQYLVGCVLIVVVLMVFRASTA